MADGQHGFVDRRDLMRQGLHVRGVHRHHGVEQEGQVDALGLASKEEVGSVAIERPRALGGGKRQIREITLADQPLTEATFRQFEYDLHGTRPKRIYRNNRAHEVWDQPTKAEPILISERVISALQNRQQPVPSKVH